VKHPLNDEERKQTGDDLDNARKTGDIQAASLLMFAFQTVKDCPAYQAMEEKKDALVIKGDIGIFKEMCSPTDDAIAKMHGHEDDYEKKREEYNKDMEGKYCGCGQALQDPDDGVCRGCMEENLMERADYMNDIDMGMFDDDPSPYGGTYSEM